MTKTVAIIGANSNTGAMIATSLAKAKYRLLLFSRDSHELISLVRKIKSGLPAAEIESMGCAANATWEADIIISAVSLNEEKELITKIEPFANRKVVISISTGGENDNPVASQAMIATQELQKLLPGARVVKLIVLPPEQQGHRRPVVIGNDKEALQVAEEILKVAGWSNNEELNSKRVA